MDQTKAEIYGGGVRNIEASQTVPQTLRKLQNEASVSSEAGGLVECLSLDTQPPLSPVLPSEGSSLTFTREDDDELSGKADERHSGLTESRHSWKNGQEIPGQKKEAVRVREKTTCSSSPSSARSTLTSSLTESLRCLQVPPWGLQPSHEKGLAGPGVWAFRPATCHAAKPCS